MRHLLLLAICALVLSGCAQRQMGTNFEPRSISGSVSGSISAPQKPAPKTVFLTIDGTANTLTNHTNPGRLHTLVESYSYQNPDRRLASFYAEGVGSGDAKVLALLIGQGVNDDIKRSFGFLTRVWQPDDPLFLNGYSRGAYTARALGGMIYLTGIPDLSALPAKRRNKIVDALFDAFKTGAEKDETPRDHAQRRMRRIAEVVAKFGLSIPAARQGGFENPRSKVVITAMSLWDSVAALGTPDGKDDPLEGPSRFLLTNCNVRHMFHALSLDDNRARSFTPILAKGAKMYRDCPQNGPSQRIDGTVKEVWFSGAHGDVGGSYDFDFMLDGQLPSVSLNWMLSNLETISPELFPKGLRVPEDRFSMVHKGDFIRKSNFKRSRKPHAYAKRAYGEIAPLALHASVADRLERLFSLDDRSARCSGTGLAEGPDLLCAQRLASYGLVPELFVMGCVEVTDWGYRVISDDEKDGCPRIIGKRAFLEAGHSKTCRAPTAQHSFTGWTFDGPLEELTFWEMTPLAVEIPYPHCLALPASTPSQ